MRTIYVLALADVHGNVDRPEPLAASYSREVLEKWEQSQRAPQPYTTEPGRDNWGYAHCYELVYKDGPLKWFNPPSPGTTAFGGIIEVPAGDMSDEAVKNETLRRGWAWITEEMVARKT